MIQYFIKLVVFIFLKLIRICINVQAFNSHKITKQTEFRNYFQWSELIAWELLQEEEHLYMIVNLKNMMKLISSQLPNKILGNDLISFCLRL